MIPYNLRLTSFLQSAKVDYIFRALLFLTAIVEVRAAMFSPFLMLYTK